MLKSEKFRLSVKFLTINNQPQSKIEKRDTLDCDLGHFYDPNQFF